MSKCETCGHLVFGGDKNDHGIGFSCSVNTSTNSGEDNALRAELEKKLYEKVTSFQAVSYEELTDDLIAIIHRERQAAERAGRIDEVRIGSDLHRIIKRADRIDWSNKRLAQLKGETTDDTA